MPPKLPCGSWPSPVTPELASAGNIRLSMLRTDGECVYWLERRPSEKGRSVLVRRSPDGQITDLTPPSRDVTTRVHEYGGGAWAIRNGNIVFSDRTDNAIWFRAANDTEFRCLPSTPRQCYADFAFSPDGRHIIAVEEDHSAEGEPTARLSCFSLDGTEPLHLAEGADFYAAPSFSPDGNFLAWIEWSHPDMPWDATCLYIARIVRDDAGNPIRLIEQQCLAGKNGTESLIEPCWENDETLISISDRSGWWAPERFLLPSGERIPLGKEGTETGQPPWVFGQRSFTCLPDGNLLALTVSDGQDATILIAPDGTITPVRMGAPEQSPELLKMTSDGPEYAWLDAPPDSPAAIVIGKPDQASEIIRMSTTLPYSRDDISLAQHLHFPTEDGATGHALFYAPVSSHATIPDGEKPPLIVMVHGGPTARASAAFSFKVQWWTSRGFAVLDVNYGGSTGFGRAWRKRLEGRWGLTDVADCIDATKEVLRRGLVDPNRIAIRGSSAGGLTVLNTLATSRIFAAGTSLYGVTDLRALAAETHKFESRYTDRLIAPWPEGEAVYLERSPLSLADRIKAPVLFLQGLEDKVVPPSQAQTMSEILRRNGNIAPLHEFPGEGHGFRSAETLKQAMILELEFYGKVFGFQPNFS